jgi:hypothetical protein
MRFKPYDYGNLWSEMYVRLSTGIAQSCSTGNTSDNLNTVTAGLDHNIVTLKKLCHMFGVAFEVVEIVAEMVTWPFAYRLTNHGSIIANSASVGTP